MMPYRPPKKTAPEGEFRGRQGSGRGETACGGEKRHKAIFHDLKHGCGIRRQFGKKWRFCDFWPG